MWSRRPILQLWKGVLADLSALQSIFKYAYQHDSTIIGRVPPDVIEPRVAVQIYNRVLSVGWLLGFSVGLAADKTLTVQKLGHMIKSKAASEQRLGKFNELRRECERKVAEIRRPYESAYTEIQLEVV